MAGFGCGALPAGSGGLSESLLACLDGARVLFSEVEADDSPAETGGDTKAEEATYEPLPTSLSCSFE